jgi:hypothetical protein
MTLWYPLVMEEPTLPSRSTIRKVGSYVTREIAGETIAVPVRANVADLEALYTFNEVGAAIWTLLDSECDEAEIAESLAETFDITAEQARQDVVRFIDTLLEAGLVERRGGETPDGD